MTVHTLAEYVRVKQQELREQNARSASPTSQSPGPSTSTKKKGGVNHVHSKSSFQTSVIEASANKIVVVDYFATWCGPCKVIAPEVAKMSNDPKYAGVDFVKIDVDEASDVAQEQGIRAMPTFKIYKNGEAVDEVVGADKRSLQNKIEALLQSMKDGTPYVRTATAQPFNIMTYVPFLMLAYLLYNYFFAGK